MAISSTIRSSRAVIAAQHGSDKDESSSSKRLDHLLRSTSADQIATAIRRARAALLLAIPLAVAAPDGVRANTADTAARESIVAQLPPGSVMRTRPVGARTRTAKTQAKAPVVRGATVVSPVPHDEEGLRRIAKQAAAHHAIPADLFLRLIRQESGFQATALSPAGAQGVAQFMPATARERGLADPFDPTQALPKSAELLRDLRVQFGNLGLAAAAYNAGPRRVRDWLAGRGGLPAETRHYVHAITGRKAESWAPSGARLVPVFSRAGAPASSAAGPRLPWELALLRTLTNAAPAGTAHGTARVARRRTKDTPAQLEASLCSACLSYSSF